ncbi:MAG: flagellar biosynthesis protein FlgD [Clostridiaceae bacterium]|nr:flagellar biosynthesis protein FlgD [Clostridiaceae bacterium]
MPDVTGVTKQMTIDQIIASQTTKTEETRNTGELGKNDFLQLLITQVQHQDPLNPSTDTEFIAQLAQFSALEQMQNLNRTFSYTSGFAMMGKFVSGEIQDEATGEVKYVSGIVESVRVLNGQIYAVVGEDDIPIDKITRVYETNLGASDKVTDYSNIIGLLGQSRIINDDGEITTIKGLIAAIEKENEEIIALLDEVEILPYRLDLGTFENEEEYVKAMANKEVELRLEDETTGSVHKIVGILCDGFIAEDGKLRLILNNVKVPASSIFSAKKVDLLNTEQLLLSQILKELQKQNSSGENENSDGDSEDSGIEDTSNV